MVSTRRKKTLNKRQFNQLDETLNDFVICNGITTTTLGNETLEPEVNGRHRDFERIFDNASQNQVIGSSTDDRIRDSAVIAVNNRMLDAIFHQ